MDGRRFVLAGGLAAAMVVVVAAATLEPSPRPADRGSLASALGSAAGPELDRRRAAAVAAATAACMDAAGHRYEPWVEPMPTVPDADLGPVEWAQRWGFGISTANGPVPAAPVDPNLRRLAHQPPDERERFTGDLYGAGTWPGCQALANDTVYGLRERLLAPLRTDLTALAASIEADPGMARAGAAWVACVTDALPTMVRTPKRPGDLDPVREWFGQRADGASAADLATIQADERRVAAAIAGCDVSFAASRQRLAAPYEGEFVKGHRAALARLGSEIRRAEAAYPSGDP